MARKLAEHKKCKRCNETKLRLEFSKHAVAPNGVQSTCKICSAKIAKERWAKRPKQDSATINRRSKLKRTFGLTIEEYDRMLAQQNGCCALCGTDTPKGRGRFHVDHCHVTNKIRGLLCNMCNVGLGHFKDSVNLLEAAISYLENEGVYRE